MWNVWYRSTYDIDHNTNGEQQLVFRPLQRPYYWGRIKVDGCENFEDVEADNESPRYLIATTMIVTIACSRYTGGSLVNPTLIVLMRKQSFSNKRHRRAQAVLFHQVPENQLYGFQAPFLRFS